MPKGKSLLNLRGKKKTPRLDEATKREMDKKMYGETPPPITDRGRFLTWCKAMVDLDTSREWLDEYLEGTGRSTRGVPKDWINPSVCHRARLKTLGAPFTPDQDRLLEEGIGDILKHAEAASEEDTPDRPTIQDRIRERASELIGELEGMIDDGITSEFDITAWYHQNEVSAKVAALILAKYVPKRDEIDEVLKGDTELVEGYMDVDKEEIFRLQEFYARIVDETEAFIRNKKREREPRKPKPVSLEKKLKRINEVYLKHSKEWNVTSVDPSKIIGAKELWTLNVKYKLLTVFRAESMGGQLDVKTCNVIGFNPNDSQTYRLGRGRKQFTVVEEVLKASKAGLKKAVAELNKSDYLLERINENTVLLRVL